MISWRKITGTVIEAFVDRLDLREMGFRGRRSRLPRPPTPVGAAQDYIYGYLNRVQSSRRLEHETQRTRADVADRPADTGLQDDANFRGQRQGHPPGVATVHRAGRQLTCHAGAGRIDGSKFKAVNNRDKTQAAKMKRAGAGQREYRALSEGDDRRTREPEVAASRRAIAGQECGLQQQMSNSVDRGTDERLAGQQYR